VTDADVSDKEHGNENEIGSAECKEKVTRRFILCCEFLVCTSELVYKLISLKFKTFLFDLVKKNFEKI
jgi:hypothetical protein